MDKVIHIPGRRRDYARDDWKPVIRISREAYNTLIDIYNESTLSLAQVASEMILQGREFVVFDKEGNDGDTGSDTGKKRLGKDIQY